MARRMKQFSVFEYHVKVQYIRLYGSNVMDDLRAPGLLLRDFWRQGLSTTDAARALGAEAGKTEAHT